jgi:hypothetical protein
MVTEFPTEYLFRRLSDFWDLFEDREDVKNAWHGYLDKSQALQSLLQQADLSKSLATIPLFDRNDFEYFIFSKLVRRPDLETNNGPFYAFEIDPAIFFIKDLNEKIDDVNANRTLSPPDFFDVSSGTGSNEGKTFLNFFRGVDPLRIGETFWTRGSDVVAGSALTSKINIGDIVQGQDKKFYKVVEVVSDTEFKMQGVTVFGEDLGPGDGVTLVYNLLATSGVIPSSVEVFFDGVAVPPANFIALPDGSIDFSPSAAPAATVLSITVNYYQGYAGATAFNRQTIRELIPSRLFSRGVYRDRRSVFTNFGVGIGLDRPTSTLYRNQVRGIYFARYKGPPTANIDLGGGILIDLPFSARGTVQNVITTDPKAVIVNGNLFQVPPPLNIIVTPGQELTRDFNLLTDGIRTSDFINDPDLFNLEPLKDTPAKYFTFVVRVSGLYAIHVAIQTGKPIDYSLLKRFKLDIKPSYTNCVIATDIDFLDEPVGLFIGAVDVHQAIDAAPTLEFNCKNFAIIPEYMETNGFPFTVADELVAAGPVAAGLFALDFQFVKNGTLELHAGTIAGPLLVETTDYTVDLNAGTVTLTAAGAAVVNGEAPPDLHAKYTSGLAGEADLDASGLCTMDSDSIGIFEDVENILDALIVNTLENNLVNFGVGTIGQPEEEMDQDTVSMVESLDINEAVGTPGGSGMPPFNPGALIYSF